MYGHVLTKQIHMLDEESKTLCLKKRKHQYLGEKNSTASKGYSQAKLGSKTLQENISSEVIVAVYPMVQHGKKQMTTS